MAPKEQKGKTADRSTKWSKETWDERGFWFSSRVNSAGETKYDYRYPKQEQTAEQQHTTPRSPGPNIFTSSDTYYSPSGSPSGPTYTDQPNTTYTATGSTVPAYATASDYRNANTPSTYTTTPSYHDTTAETSAQDEPQANSEVSVYSSTRPQSSGSDASTVRRAMSPANSAALAVSRSLHTSSTSYNVLSTGLQTLSMSPPLTVPESTYGAPLTQEDSYGSQTSPSNSTELDPRFTVVDKNNEKRFWRIGRVFLALWTEPARQGLVRNVSHGAPGGPSTSSQVSDVYLGSKAFTEIRRFVVVGEGWGNSICSPIHTYQGQATLKQNLPEAQQHAIIYTTPEPPYEYWYTAESGEEVRENLSKDPIKVNKSKDIGVDGDLGTASRLNYSKVYTVEHYVPVRNIGMVNEGWIPTLQENSFVKRRDGPEKPRRNPPNPDSKGTDKKVKGKGRASRDPREKEKRSTHR